MTKKQKGDNEVTVKLAEFLINNAIGSKVNLQQFSVVEKSRLRGKVLDVVMHKPNQLGIVVLAETLAWMINNERKWQTLMDQMTMADTEGEPR